jgi:hypothetical protein
MPRASVLPDEVEKLDLQSIPGGWVTLKRMTYGQKLYRQAQAAKMRVSSDSRKSFSGEMDLMNVGVTLQEIVNCVVDHNLYKDEAETEKFDLHNPVDIQALDPRVGEEISTKIGEMNNFEAKDEQSPEGNSLSASKEL